MALFLTENDVKQVLTATMALEAVESAHRDLALGQAQDTPRARTRLPQTVLHILQGALPAQGVIGYKAYTSNRSGNRDLGAMVAAHAVNRQGDHAGSLKSKSPRHVRATGLGVQKPIKLRFCFSALYGHGKSRLG